VLQNIYFVSEGDFARERPWWEGGVFAISFLLILWLINLDFKKKTVNESKIWGVTKTIMACYAIGGIVFILLIMIAFVWDGADGIDIIFDNMMLIILLGGLGSAPFVIKRLR
jgi:hypothetical protein